MQNLQAADEIGGDLLGGAGEEGLGEWLWRGGTSSVKSCVSAGHRSKDPHSLGKLIEWKP